jgi:3-oxoacyl-[acyl-carrier protein] reductase
MLDEVIQAGESAGSEFNDAIERQEKGGTDIKVPTGLISFLVSEESDGITGKIISAPWDKWQDADFQNELRVDKDIATLRRIDNKYFYKKK